LVYADLPGGIISGSGLALDQKQLNYIGLGFHWNLELGIRYICTPHKNLMFQLAPGLTPHPSSG